MSIATIHIGLAHEGHEHAEPVVVRAIDYNQDTDTYTFQCTIPEEAGDEPVTWSVRTSKPACTIYDVQSTDGLLEWSPSMLSNPDEMNNAECQTMDIQPNDLMHFGCQVVYFPPPNYESVLLRGDFHLDFRPESERTGQYDDTPNIVVHDSEGLFVDIECIPQTGQDPSQVSWTFHHPTTQSTDSFLDVKRISRTLAHAGIWDVACEVAGQSYHLPIEFFQNGPAYVPTADGCVPGETCYVNGTPPTQPTSFAGPTWVGPAQDQVDVEPHHFNLNVFPLEDATNGAWVSSDFEIWDMSSGTRVWRASQVSTTHVRNGDGVFEGLLSGMTHLSYDTQYRTRARYHTTQGVSDWSEWRRFTTREASDPSQSQFTWTPRDGYKIELVSSNVNMPVMLRSAPDIYDHLEESQRPLLYVTQLYGQIGMIRQDGSYVQYANNLLNYQTFGSLPGSGEMGVTGLYVDENGDVLASFVNYDTAAQAFYGVVERFHTNADGTGYTHRTTLLTGVPVSPAHQVQDITRGPDGKLYVGTGDADDPQGANNLANLYGKILRMNDDGSMPADNPLGGYIYASGFRNPFSMDFRPGANTLFVTNNGEDSNDAVYRVGAGDRFGWCANGVCDTSVDAWQLWPQSVVPTAIRFDDGSSVFPADSHGSMYVVLHGPTVVPGTTERGKRIVQIHINADGSASQPQELVTYTGDGFGTPLGLEFGSDGLYFSDFLGEAGFVGLGQSNGNIYRVVPGVQTVDPVPQPDGSLQAGISPAQWYPQGLNMVWECRATGGSGEFLYSFIFGDGNGQYRITGDNVYYTYPADGVYITSCTVHDTATGEEATATTQFAIGNVPADPTPPSNGTPPGGNGGSNGSDGNGDGETPPSNVCQTLADMPVTCQGTIVSDTFDGCRHITCESGSQSMQVLACEKPDIGAREYFEIYRQSYSGAPLEVCIGSTCIKDNGFARSNNYVCEEQPQEPGEQPPEPPEPEQPGICATAVTALPATCTGGTIVSDMYDGCRHITCESASNSLSVLACDKPDGAASPEHVEMYRLSTMQASGSIDICLGDTCLGSGGFAKQVYPVCTGNQEPDVPSEPEEPVNEQGASLRVADWYPQGLHSVFVCEETGFVAESYKFSFGDGHSQTRAVGDVYHIYDAPGTYEVSCIAQGEGLDKESDIVVVIG